MAKHILTAVALFLFASVAAAQTSYKVRAGDTLRIEVLEDQSLNRNALVLPDGSISVPLVGSVAAAGKDLSAVQAAVEAGLAPNFATKPTVFVTVNSLSQPKATASRGSSAPSTMDVYVMGEVQKPGKASVKPGTSILQFLAESGGFTKFAATKRIQVRRTDPKSGKAMVYGFNYKAVEQGSTSVNSIILKEGDVIVVPERRLFE